VDVRQQILLAQRLGKGRGATRVLCRGCSMWRHKALRSGWCWRMRSLTPKPTTSTFGTLGAKSIIPARRRGVPNGAIRNQMFRAFPKKPYRQRSKIESIFSAVNANLLARTRTQPGTQVRPSPVARPCLQHVPLRHRFAQGGCNRAQVLKQTPYGNANSL